MKLTIPVNWEDDYFEKIDFSATEEIYGKLNVGLIGGGIRLPLTPLSNNYHEPVRRALRHAGIAG